MLPVRITIRQNVIGNISIAGDPIRSEIRKLKNHSERTSLMTRRLSKKGLVIALILSAGMVVIYSLVTSPATSQAACVTAAPGALAQNTAFASQAGAFTAGVCGAPSAPPNHGWVGVSPGAQTGMSRCACV